jgi:hypothetical protein
LQQSQLDFLAEDGDVGQGAGAGASADQVEDGLTERRIVFEKEKPLLAAELVEVANPNAPAKQNVKAKDIDFSEPQPLSRRER